VSSLDIQTYLWYPDHSGRLILERSVEAANRGVHVRLIVDDLLTIGLDQVIYELEQHPNIEFRLFNPWKSRGTLRRAGEMIAEMERLNTRMHDKLLIADGNAAVVGGRNIGDHYFGLSHDYNFHDLDLLAFGHVAQQANGMFDSFWNSEWVVSAENLVLEADPEFAREKWQALQARNRGAEELEAFGVEPPAG
jgi:putative cardiolipin synthase